MRSALLYFCLGHLMLRIPLRSYRLVPMGSFSRIERTTGDKAIYELYGSGDLHFGRLLHNRRFDFAMVAFLDCVKQLMDYVKSQDPQVDFPHPSVPLPYARDPHARVN